MDIHSKDMDFCDWCGCPLADHEIAKKDFDGVPSMICDCCEEELMNEDLEELPGTGWIPDIEDFDFSPQPDCELCIY